MPETCAAQIISRLDQLKHNQFHFEAGVSYLQLPHKTRVSGLKWALKQKIYWTNAFLSSLGGKKAFTANDLSSGWRASVRKRDV